MPELDSWSERRHRIAMRPDAHLAMRPDAYRFLPRQPPRWATKEEVWLFWGEPHRDPRQPKRADPDVAARLDELLRLKRELAEIKSLLRQQQLLSQAKAYDPNQPRILAGNLGGGQWTTEGAQGTPTRLAGPIGSRGPRSPIGRPQLEPTPGQAARLAIAEAQARNAIARVRELDPKWKPTPSFRETIEGQILAAQEETLEAHARLRELASLGIGPGPNAHESLLARGPGRDFNVREREEGNRIGQEWGCHTCGTQNPGSLWVILSWTTSRLRR